MAEEITQSDLEYIEKLLGEQTSKYAQNPFQQLLGEQTPKSVQQLEEFLIVSREARARCIALENMRLEIEGKKKLAKIFATIFTPTTQTLIFFLVFLVGVLVIFGKSLFTQNIFRIIEDKYSITYLVLFLMPFSVTIYSLSKTIFKLFFKLFFKSLIKENFKEFETLLRQTSALEEFSIFILPQHRKIVRECLEKATKTYLEIHHMYS